MRVNVVCEYSDCMCTFVDSVFAHRTTQTEQHMIRSIALWTLALLITLGSAYYQRKTGPTHPIDGHATFLTTDITWELLRSHGGDGDMPVEITAPNPLIRGVLVWRRLHSHDEWQREVMQRDGDKLVGAIPHQPPAGKVQYRVELTTQGATLSIPESGDPVVTRFKGAVPPAVLIPHIIFIFLAMLFSTRAGIEALSAHGHPRMLTFWATGLMLLGGMIFGPLVQKYAFDAYWTGFPFGTDLTDNKTLIAFIAWLIASMFVWEIGKLKQHPGRRWAVVIAAVVTFIVFIIPHSMFGSELRHVEEDPHATSGVHSVHAPIPFA